MQSVTNGSGYFKWEPDLSNLAAPLCFMWEPAFHSTWTEQQLSKNKPPFYVFICEQDNAQFSPVSRLIKLSRPAVFYVRAGFHSTWTEQQMNKKTPSYVFICEQGCIFIREPPFHSTLTGELIEPKKTLSYVSFVSKTMSNFNQWPDRANIDAHCVFMCEPGYTQLEPVSRRVYRT